VAHFGWIDGNSYKRKRFNYQIRKVAKIKMELRATAAYTPLAHIVHAAVIAILEIRT